MSTLIPMFTYCTSLGGSPIQNPGSAPAAGVRIGAKDGPSLGPYVITDNGVPVSTGKTYDFYGVFDDQILNLAPGPHNLELRENPSLPQTDTWVLAVAEDFVVKFLNGPFSVAPGGRVKRIRLLLTHSGQGVSGTITLTLPTGMSHDDGTVGSRDYNTQPDGTLAVTGVRAGELPGTSTIVASNGQASASASLVTTVHGPARNIAVGVQPLGLTLSADGTRLYVAQSVSASVKVIDTSTSTLIQNIFIPGQQLSWSIAVDNEEERGYSCDITGPVPLSVIDLGSATVTDSLVAGGPAGGVVLNEAETLAYVTNFRHATLTVLDLITQKSVKAIPVGIEPWAVDISKDQRRVFVCSARVGLSTNSITAIDTQSLSVYGSVPVGSSFLYGLKVSPDNRYVFVCVWINNLKGEIWQIDTQTLSVLRTIPISGTPRDIVLNRAGNRAYCCTAHGHVAVIDLLLGVVIQMIPVGLGSVSIAISHDDKVVYVASGQDNHVYVIHLDQQPGGAQSANAAGIAGAIDPVFGEVQSADTPPFFEFSP